MLRYGTAMKAEVAKVRAQKITKRNARPDIGYFLHSRRD
jgi:hypothetical protein